MPSCQEDTVPSTHRAGAGEHWEANNKQAGARAHNTRGFKRQPRPEPRISQVRRPQKPAIPYRAHTNRAHTQARAPRQPTSTHNTARAEEKRDEKEGKERWKVKGRGRKRQGEGEEKESGKDGRRGQEGEARRSKGRGREGKGLFC